MVEFTGEFGESGLDGGPVQSGNGFGLEDFAGGVLGIGGFAEFEGPLVLFVFGHKQILNPGSFPNDEHEESGGNRSSVPQWPTLRWLKRRRTKSTISWEVLPGGLSTSNKPSS